MRTRPEIAANSWREKLVLVLAVVAALAGPVVASALTGPAWSQTPAAQLPAIPEWQTDAGGKMAFDSADVRWSKSNFSSVGDGQYSNVPLGAGNYYSPTGGYFSARNEPLYTYIVFAYKATSDQTLNLRSQVPRWVLSNRFDIEARVRGNPTKDQMRLMMQSLLADRFKLAVHYDTREGPVLDLVQARLGKLGPRLRSHPDYPPCSTVPEPPPDPGSGPAPPPIVKGGYPETCGGIEMMRGSVRGRLRLGARDVTMGMIASSMPGANDGPGLPVVDKTGLGGTFDFTLEWELGGTKSGHKSSFEEALHSQLGLNLEPHNGSYQVFVVDHVEPPPE